MWYLFLQIWIWIAGAFIFGWFCHWFLCCRNKEDEVVMVEANSGSNEIPKVVENTPPAAVAIDEAWKPQGFSSAPDRIDDLKRIKGVGAVIEKTLHGLGVYQFEQITAWTQDNVAWVENFLAFPGRIDREDWIEQAKTLSTGGTTEFAKRVDKGDVDYT